MSIDIKRLIQAMWKSAFPWVNTASLPTIGPGAGDDRYLPIKNVERLANALNVPMLAAAAEIAGGVAIIPLATVELDLVDYPVTHIPEPAPGMPGGGVGVRATKRYRLNKRFGGVAWNYENGQLYLVPLEQEDAADESRKLYLFDPDGSPRVSESGIELVNTDDVTHPQARYRYLSRLESLSFSAGQWRAFQTYLPPLYRGLDEDPLMHAVGIWTKAGAPAEPAHRLNEDAYPSYADRVIDEKHEYAYTSRRNGLYIWRAGVTNPWTARSFATIADEMRPADIDGDSIDNPFEYLVMFTPRGIIRWLDVQAWDATGGGGGAHYALWKSFVAFDAMGGIQDITIDRANNRLWVLTDNELQRYDLDDYYDPESLETNENAAHALIAIDPPTMAQEEVATAIVFQLLDMWGRPTQISGATVEVTAANDRGLFTAGDLQSLTIRVPSTLGIVMAVYTPAEDSAGATETIIARVVEE